MQHPVRRLNTAKAKRSTSSASVHPLYHDQAPTDSWLPHLVYDEEESYFGDGRRYFDDSDTF